MGFVELGSKLMVNPNQVAAIMADPHRPGDTLLHLTNGQIHAVMLPYDTVRSRIGVLETIVYWDESYSEKE